MEDSHLCLTWNDHGINYQQELADLRNENVLTDVTLACDGQKFLAHKLVLATCSEFFKSILGDAQCQHPIVYLRGVDGKVMKALLDFMYIGTIEFPKENLNCLLSTAQALQIKSLGVLAKDQKVRSEQHPCSKRKRSTDSYYLLNDNKTSSSQFLKRGSEHVDSSEVFYPDREQAIEIIESPRNIIPPTLGLFQNKENVNQNRQFENGSDILSSLLFKQKSSHFAQPNSNGSGSYHTSLNATSTASSMNHSMSQVPLTTEVPKSSTGFEETANMHYAENLISSNQEDNPHNVFATDIKEEPLDCSQGSTLERVEISVSESQQNILTEKDASQSLSKIQDVNQPDFLEKLSRVSTAQLSLLQQEENLENGIENGRPYACPICQKSFAKAAILKRHHLAHFRPYGCHLCPRSFTRREVLAEHVLEHNGADMRLPCPVCHMTIKRKRNLQAHIKVKHPDYFKQKSNKEAV